MLGGSTHFAGRTHPSGACHQKIIVADDTFAFCGCIDATQTGWDGPHRPDRPPVSKDGRRLRNHGTTSPPPSRRHRAGGAVAHALATRPGDTLTRPDSTDTARPAGLQVCDIDVAIARTEPYDGATDRQRDRTSGSGQHRDGQGDTIYNESQYLRPRRSARRWRTALKGRRWPRKLSSSILKLRCPFGQGDVLPSAAGLIDRFDTVDHQGDRSHLPPGPTALKSPST
jgi:hypothetical protein